jgi:hypothetical protein
VRRTFLDLLGYDVVYTNNNNINTRNYGIKELCDVNYCINEYDINDDDFVVKMTGRYILNVDSEFMTVLKNIHDTTYECVFRYGSYSNPVNYKMDDCITGLICMKCKVM